MTGFRLAAALAASVALGALAAPASADEKVFSHTFYDGVTNDLLTAGLGKTGLGGAAPGSADPLNPTAEELRRLAIYNNYRALIDPTPGGGYGTLYGPNVDVNGVPTAGEGKIAGDEYIAYEDGSGGGKRNVTMMVQVPSTYDPSSGCIVTAPSSGSRGVYGAIATAGEWGLKRGCAVAYTDKGTGTGAHDLQNNSVNLIRGERADAAAAGKESNFTADLKPRDLAAFNAATPNRVAFKHAHSQQNPEADWGRNVLRSIKFAFEVLDRKFAPQGVKISKRNTIVIASSVSNGGGASVRAVEEDDEKLIDGLAVGEPNVNPKKANFAIVQGAGAPFSGHSKPLMDYITLVNVFYFGLNNIVDGSLSSLRYYEVTNAHHLDTLNAAAGYNDKYIPLHRYFIQAMDLMYAHLRLGAPLPPSQVVHTIPRGPGAPPITAANVPPIAAVPAPGVLITFSGGQVNIPD